jgi:hypothetical protein
MLESVMSRENGEDFTTFHVYFPAPDCGMKASSKYQKWTKRQEARYYDRKAPSNSNISPPNT